LLEAVGEHIGKAIYLQEISEETPRVPYANYSANVSSNSLRVISGGVDTGDDSLSFSQIKLRFVILAKFEIQ